jgi:hypothetical protein
MDNTATATKKQAPRDKNVHGWRMRLPVDVLERTCTLSPRAFRTLLAIEGFCRDDWRCWPSNQEIARLAGCQERQVRSCLTELTDAGWIYCLLTADKHTREAIVMRQRLDPDLPVALPGYRAESVTDPPPGVHALRWHEYLEVRNTIKNPVTTLREKFLIIRKLAELQKLGNPPNEVLAEAGFHGSSALLPLKS